MKPKMPEKLELDYTPTPLFDTANVTNEKWLQMRNEGIGGSESSICLGVNPWTTKRELYYQKVGVEPVQKQKNATLEAGHKLEELVAQIFSRKTGLKIFEVKKMFQHPLYPYLTANVDRFVQLPDGTLAILECKTSSEFNKSKWENGKVPINYEVQGRHYMSVCNINKCYFACWFISQGLRGFAASLKSSDTNNLDFLIDSLPDNEFVIREIDRDFDFEKNIIEADTNFWYDYVVPKIEPPLESENSDKALEVLSKYIEKKEDKVILPNGFENLLDNYTKLKSEKSKLEDKAKKIDEEIKKLSVPLIEALKGSPKGVCGKYEVSYSSSKRTSLNKAGLEKLKHLYPDFYTDNVSTSISKPTFRVKEIK